MTRAICIIHPRGQIQISKRSKQETGDHTQRVLSHQAAVGAAPEFEAATDPDRDVALGE